MRKFKVKYYEIDGVQQQKIVTEEVIAETLKIKNGMAIFYENAYDKTVIAAYPDFISVKRE